MLPTSVVAVKVGVVSLVMPSAFDKPVSEKLLFNRSAQAAGPGWLGHQRAIVVLTENKLEKERVSNNSAKR